MLTKPEEKRLSTLQVAYAKPIDAWGDERLTVRDFLLLLNHDDSVRQLIKDIVQDNTLNTLSDQNDDPDFDEVLEKPAPMSAPATIPKRPAPVPTPVVVVQKPDILRTDLAPELQLLRLVNKDLKLARAWLGEEEEPEGRQLVRLVAVASQWNQILLLWDRLAERCRQAQRKATQDELSILGSSLDLHNLIWDGKAAEMQHANLGDSFDYDYHERGRSTGDDVRGEWLPGLISAAGMRQRKILVAT
jgi:hypothetical protein